MNTEIVKVNKTDIECPYENEQHYVAVRSICRALGIDHQKQFERIKNDPILKDAYTDTVYASDSTSNRKQAMFCLPVKYVFGWIFTIDDAKVSDRARPTFLKYKQECYDVLFEHFYIGSASQRRKELLKRKAALQMERSMLELELRNNEMFTNLEKLKAEEARLGKSLKEIDEQEIEQERDLFSSSGVEIES